MWIKIPVVTFLCYFLCQFKDISTHSNEERTEKLEKHERFRDIFPLTQKNFTQKVLKGEDAWIVLFHTGNIKRSWKTMAVSLRGVISFGMIDIHQQPELVGKLNYDIKNDLEARVYPYGSKQHKEKYVTETSNPNQARSEAVRSIPNYILDVKNMGIEDFIVDCLMSKPSRFPVIIFTESREMEPMYKVLAMKLERYFNFGHMINPSTSDLKQLGIEEIYIDMPSMMVLTTENDNLDDPKFNAIQYSKTSHGETNYPNLLKFLVNINRKFRHVLPGENYSNSQEDIEMSEVLQRESDKFEIIDEPHVLHTNVISDSDFIVDGLGGKISDEL